METLKFTEEQSKAYRLQFAPKATDEQWSYFRLECERRGLIPGVHVIFQLRNQNEFDRDLQRDVTVQKVALITTINALRLIADRSGKFKGYGRFQYYYKSTAPAEDSLTTFAIPMGKVPHAVGVELFREGWVSSVYAVARYDACVQIYNGSPTRMWFKRGEEQLAKCAEANGLRMVAPEECGGLYIEEEMPGLESVERDTRDQQPTPQETPAPVVNTLPTATVAPAVNQAPAQADAPKPAAPVTTAPPKPSAPAKPALRPAPPKTPAAPQAPPTAPVTAPVNNRLPADMGDGHETVKEMQEFAERVARDADPVVATPATVVPEAETNIHGVAATDADLPENLQPVAPVVEANPTPAAETVQPVVTPTPQPTAAQPVAPAPTVSELPTPTEYQTFMSRAAKVLRDKLEKEGKLKNASALLQAYIVKGYPKLNKIPKTTLEEKIGGLEKATAEEAVAIVKG